MKDMGFRFKAVVGIGVLSMGWSTLVQAENDLAEDPSTLALVKHQSSGERPWAERTPEELRVWANKEKVPVLGYK